MAKGEEVLEKLRKKNPPCLTGKKHSFVPGTPILIGDRTNKPIQDIRVGEQVLATDPETGKTAGRAVTHLIVGEGDKNLRELTVDTDGATGQARPGHMHHHRHGHPPLLGRWETGDPCLSAVPAEGGDLLA
ncbi:hypothetical protein ACQEVM_36790 [Streptomyces sp. CA-243310]|uniref:hypothetical protein n=1 Tax=Streptomyces sp. CA-243310 TaxID=3240056 RepID=UPI003D8C5E7F